MFFGQNHQSLTGRCSSLQRAEVFGYPLDGPKDDDHGGWMPTEALAAQKKKRWR